MTLIDRREHKSRKNGGKKIEEKAAGKQICDEAGLYHLQDRWEEPPFPKDSLNAQDGRWKEPATRADHSLGGLRGKGVSPATN